MDFVEAARPALERLAQEIFADLECVEWISDPEIEDDARLQFRVRAMGSIQEILASESEWHRRSAEILPEHFRLLRLSIDAGA